jgi:hypothetical protein
MPQDASQKDANFFFREWVKGTVSDREREETNSYNKKDCPWCDERINYDNFFKEHPEYSYLKGMKYGKHK